MTTGENVDAVMLRHQFMQCDIAGTPLRDYEFAQAPCNGSADQAVALQDCGRIDITKLSRSERTRQIENVFGYVGQNLVGRNRRDLIQPRFAEFALAIVFGCEAEAAVELQAGIRRLP